MAGSNNVSKNGETKLCKGPLHREGVRLPLNRFYHSENGKPYSQCIDCRNALLGRMPDSGLISWHDAEPVFERLFELTGGMKEAAISLGLRERYFLPGTRRPKVKIKTFNAARDKIQEIEKAKRNNPNTQPGSPEVVLAEPLGGYIRAWCERWDKERPNGKLQTGQKYGTGGNQRDFMAPVTWLAEKTGIHPDRVSQIKNSRHPRVPLQQADAILTAMGEFYRLHEDVTVIPNPMWDMEVWYEYMRERGCI